MFVCSDFFTDPAIHTIDGQGFGLGNFGKDGACAFFLNHQCSSLCRELQLPPFELSLPELALRPARNVVDAPGTSLERVVSLAPSGVEAAEGLAPEPVKLAAALGQLHVRMAFRYLRKLSGQIEDDGSIPAETLCPLSSDGDLRAAMMHHAATAGALLRATMPAKAATSGRGCGARHCTLSLHRSREQWLTRQFEKRAEEARESLSRFKSMVAEYDQTEDILLMQGNCESVVKMFSQCGVLHWPAALKGADVGRYTELCARLGVVHSPAGLASMSRSLGGGPVAQLTLDGGQECPFQFANWPVVSDVKPGVRLQEIYERFKPSKIADIDKLLKEFVGREDELLANVEDKYLVPNGETRASLRYEQFVGMALTHVGGPRCIRDCSEHDGDDIEDNPLTLVVSEPKPVEPMDSTRPSDGIPQPEPEPEPEPERAESVRPPDSLIPEGTPPVRNDSDEFVLLGADESSQDVGSGWVNALATGSHENLNQTLNSLRDRPAHLRMQHAPPSGTVGTVDAVASTNRLAVRVRSVQDVDAPAGPVYSLGFYIDNDPHFHQLSGTLKELSGTLKELQKTPHAPEVPPELAEAAATSQGKQQQRIAALFQHLLRLPEDSQSPAIDGEWLRSAAVAKVLSLGEEAQLAFMVASQQQAKIASTLAVGGLRHHEGWLSVREHGDGLMNKVDNLFGRDWTRRYAVLHWPWQLRLYESPRATTALGPAIGLVDAEVNTSQAGADQGGSGSQAAFSLISGGVEHEFMADYLAESVSWVQALITAPLEPVVAAGLEPAAAGVAPATPTTDETERWALAEQKKAMEDTAAALLLWSSEEVTGLTGSVLRLSYPEHVTTLEPVKSLLREVSSVGLAQQMERVAQTAQATVDGRRWMGAGGEAEELDGYCARVAVE